MWNEKEGNIFSLPLMKGFLGFIQHRKNEFAKTQWAVTWLKVVLNKPRQHLKTTNYLRLRGTHCWQESFGLGTELNNRPKPDLPSDRMQNAKLICQQTWLSQHKYALMIQLATLLTTAEKRQRVLHWGLTDALFQTSWITASWVQLIYCSATQSSMNHQILQPHWFYSKQHKMFHRSIARSIVMEGITGSAVGYLALCEALVVLTTLDHKCSSWVKLSLITWQSTINRLSPQREHM